MMECWNIGIMGWRPSGRYTTAAKRGKLGSYEAGEAGGTIIYLTPSLYLIIPPFHHSIIPVWHMQNDWQGIPYYQQFVEFPIHY
jgi:hypothetical protein